MSSGEFIQFHSYIPGHWLIPIHSLSQVHSEIQDHSLIQVHSLIPIHSHIPIPIWAIAEIIMAFIIPGITVLSRKSVRNVENVN